MKFTCEKSSFITALSIVSKAVSSRSSLPIISGVFLELNSKKLSMTGTDLEISLIHELEVDGQIDGKAIFSARILGDIFKGMPGESVLIEVIDGNQAHISCETVSYSLNLLNVDDWPEINIKQEETDVSLPLEILETAVRRVIKASSRDETRRILTGVLMNIENQDITIVATDSYRLAINKQRLTYAVRNDFKAILTARVLDEVVKIGQMTGSKEISIKYNDNHIIFYMKNTRLKSRLMEGTYPEYEKLVPDNRDIKIDIKKQVMVDAVKRMSILGRSSSPILMEIGKKEITMSAQSAGIGQGYEIIKTEYEGKEEKIAFNGQYLLDGLNSADEDIVIELSDSKKPGVLKNLESDEYLYLLMPVRI